MLNKKIILSILILGLLVVSAASAAENVTPEINPIGGLNNDTVGITDNNQILSDTENTGTFNDLKTEIEATSSGGVLNLNRNYMYTDNDAKDIFISKAITIEGNGYTLDGNENANMFTVTNSDVILKNLNFINSFDAKKSAVYGSCTLINCSFINCNSQQKAGAFYSSTGPSSLTNCDFISNSAYRGGAIYLNSGSCNISNCNFINNSVTNYGGAIFATSDSTYEISDCDFINNSATNYGGAIYTEGSGQITNSNFKNNHANSDGGSIYAKMDLEIINCNFTDNAAGRHSGAIHQYSGSCSISNSNFINNNAASNGGAIFASTDSTYEIDGCNFANNHAQNGGCIYGDGSITNSNFENNSAGNFSGGIFTKLHSTVTNCYFADNCAENNDGGAIYSYTNSSCYVTDCTFIRNYAKRDGGAISSSFEDYSVTGCIFNDNRAEVNGGAIRCEGTIDNCNFTNNNAKCGGAVFTHSDTCNIENCNFINNRGKDVDGGVAGAVYTITYASILKSTFINNTAYRAGAVYGSLDLDQCNFIDNSAEYGGVFYHKNNSTITDCNFTNNYARSSGGVIYSYVDSSLCRINDCNFVNNEVKNIDGGAIYTGVGSTFEINNCKFINNTANKHNGGAIISHSDACDINNSTFTNNSAIRGGGIYIYYHADFSNCNFTNCQASSTGAGGAIFSISNSSSDVDNCNFNDNYAGKGGALYSMAQSNLNNCNFTHNSAQNGGAVFGSCSADNCRFITNSATNSGGAIHAKTQDNTTYSFNVINSIFNNNNAEQFGGAVYGEGDLSNCDFTHNTAKQKDGGAVYSTNSCNVSYCNFNNNTARNGGALFNISEAHYCSFEECSATNYGGALYASSVYDSTFYNCAATNKGNAIAQSVAENCAFMQCGKENEATYKSTITDCTFDEKSYVTIDCESNITAAYNDGQTLVATLKDNKNIGIKDLDVDVQLNGVQSTLRTDANGQITIYLNDLVPNTYTATITFSGNELYYGSTATAEITINKADTAITAHDVSVAYKDTTDQIIGTITDAYGNARSVYVTVNLNRVDYSVRANSKGQISISTADLTPGTYTATISYKGNGNYNPATATTQITVNKADTVITAPDVSVAYKDTNGKLVATITNTYGKALSVYLTVNINGVDQTVKANSKGQITVSTADLTPGRYTATITYAGNVNYNPTTTTAQITVNKADTVITAPDVSVAYKNTTNQIIGTITDAYGNARSVYVNITLNGAKYTVRANSQGQISISTANLAPGTYTATISYKGNGNYNPATATTQITVNKADTVITAPDVSVAYKDTNGKLVATITNTYGKALSVYLTVNINGVDQTVRANSQGQITVSTADLAPGTYTATITYAGNGNYNPTTATTQITVNKADTIITAQDVTVDCGDPDGKLVATLTNAYGKPLSVYVNVNLNGKTFALRADSQGTINIPTKELASGNYTATITYAGNGNYNPTSTTANIQVN